ncbi:MAG: hypothetical protein HC809_17245 [Gammaproteobacteria bacterium]|nr:hypothetical protein [Gammaproteobacteria bacterium]
MMASTNRSSLLERLAAAIGLAAMLSGCTSVVSSVTADLSDGLAAAVLDSEDLQGVLALALALE